MASSAQMCISLYPLLLLTVSPLHCLSSFFSSQAPSSCGPGRSWAVRLNTASVKAGHSLDRLAQNVAEDVGLENHGQIGQLEGHYLLCQGLEDTANVDPHSTKSALEENPHVVWHSQEQILKRSKRTVTFNDPKYPSQWHLVSDTLHLSQLKSITIGSKCFDFNHLTSPRLLLQHNDVKQGMDINVTGVWERNITGVGVTVVVVDDGVQHDLADIQPNYVSELPSHYRFKMCKAV